MLWECADISYSTKSGGRILSHLPQAANFCLMTGVEVKCFPLLKEVIKKMWLLWSSLELKLGNQRLLIYLPVLGIDSLPTIHWQWELCWRPRLEIVSSVAQSCLTLCDPKDYSTPGLPVHCQLQSLLKRMSIESVMPSNHHPQLAPSPPAFNLSQHQGLFTWVSSSHLVAKVLQFQLQHQSFQCIFMTDFL